MKLKPLKWESGGYKPEEMLSIARTPICSLFAYSEKDGTYTWNVEGVFQGREERDLTGSTYCIEQAKIEAEEAFRQVLLMVIED